MNIPKKQVPEVEKPTPSQELEKLQLQYNELLYTVLDPGMKDNRTPEEAHRQTLIKARRNKIYVDVLWARLKLHEPNIRTTDIDLELTSHPDWK
jgi:hypothetical protein